MTDSSRVALLLSEILRSPVSPATSQLSQFLATDSGMGDFLNNLRAGNPLAFIYLKQNIQQWIQDHSHTQLYAPEFVQFLVGLPSRGMRHFVGDYIGCLSKNGLIGRAMIEQFCAMKAFDMLDCITRKYTELPRSNELFLEIKFVIEQTAGLLTEIFFSQRVCEITKRYYLAEHQRGAVDSRAFSSTQAALLAVSPLIFSEAVLGILYALLYQDIHPFFEDNRVQLFRIFFVLFDDPATRQTAVRMYDLFITKYPDCTDFSMAIHSLSRGDSLDPAAMSVVTKAFSYKGLHPEILVDMLRRVLAFVLDEEDMETYTRGVLRGVDPHRGCAQRLLKALYSSYGEGLLGGFTGENALHVGTVLRLKRDWLVAEARGIIADASAGDATATFSAFLYLVLVNSVDLDWLTPELAQIHFSGSSRYVFIKFVSQALKNVDHFHEMAITGRATAGAPDSTLLWNHIIPALKVFITKMPEPFSTELFARIVRISPPSQACMEELFLFLSKALEGANRMAITPLGHLLDVYILFGVRLRKYNLQLVEDILNEELTEAYPLCFLYLAVLVRETDIPAAVVMDILKQDVLWGETECRLPLVLLLASAYKRGMAGKAHVTGVSECLSQHHAAVLLSQCGLAVATTDPVVDYIVNGVFNSAWFMENYIEKKYSRMVIRKLARDEGVPARTREVVISNNMRNVEHEVTLHSITCYFGI